MPGLRDTSVTPRVLLISALSAAIGALAAGAAWCLVRLIALVTDLVWFGRVGTRLRAPDPHRLGWWSVLLPVAGGLVVGLMARFGSERIRGHGTPETIEAVLVHGSRIAPRMTVLKPVSAAIAIGTGGPFGAEGPIIATGGALGSLLAQSLRLTADERKVLLVSGAAAGMSAIFGTPVAAVLFALELLLYEYRARSLVPVALAAGLADLLRGPLLGSGALFPSPALPHLSAAADAGALGLGLVAGGLAVALTHLVAGCEHAFRRVPVHWMWWPALGGLAIGAGGWVEPRVLGVGYGTIGDTLTGRVGIALAAAVLGAKAVVWAVGLGSGTSGGVVAPVLFLGCALGTVAGGVLPSLGTGDWALLGMAALMAGMLRAPLTALVFALELSDRPQLLLALLLAVVPAYLVTALLLKRSILTERLASRGNHVRTELNLDPLETLLVRDVLPAEVVTLAADLPVEEAAQLVLRHRAETAETHGVQQRLYPVLDDAGALVGVWTRRLAVDTLLDGAAGTTLADVVIREPLTCPPDVELREAAHRMADFGVTRLVVTEGGRVRGVLSLAAVLEARLRDLDEERTAERVLRLRRAVRAVRA